MKRIVILGGGFAGASCAQGLERALGPGEAEVVLLDRNNYFVFTPLLVEAGTGSLEPRHAVVPLRDFLSRTTPRAAEVTGADLRRRTVRYRIVGREQEEELSWDHLVVTLGSVTRMPPVPGLAEYGFEMKSLTDAVALRDWAIQMLERADAAKGAEERRALLRFLVVGGNFTGVEVAGEFDVFLAEASRYYRNVDPDECTVTLLELGPRILGALDPELSDYALGRMRSRGVEVRLGESVAEVGRDFALLRGGERIETHTVIWCAGIAPPPLLKTLGLPTDEQGYLRTGPEMRVAGLEGVWGAGDCAAVPDASGRPYPSTAQHAVRQGRLLALNLARSLRGQPPRPAEIGNLGALAALGCRTAVAKVFGVKLSGFAAWFLWRTVYLLKMPGWARKVRVALDWTLGLFFRRSIVQLGAFRLQDRKR